MENKLIISAIVLMVIGFTTVIVTDDRGIELNPTHACLSKELKMYCDRLSATEITCYPNELRIGYKRCSEGWVEIPTQSVQEYEISTSGRHHYNSDGCIDCG